MELSGKGVERERFNLSIDFSNEESRQMGNSKDKTLKWTPKIGQCYKAESGPIKEDSRQWPKGEITQRISRQKLR